MCRTPVGRERHVSDSTLKQIAQLNKLSFSELQARWRSLLGTEPPAYHRRFLVKRLAYRIQELAYGGLPEATRAQMADILQDAGLDEQASIPGRGRMPKRPQDLPLALAGITGIIITHGFEPEPATLAKAEEEGIPVLTTPAPSFEVAGRLYGLGVQ